MFSRLIAAARFGSETCTQKDSFFFVALSLPGACIVICLGALAASYMFIEGLIVQTFLQYDDNYTHIAFAIALFKRIVFSTLKHLFFGGLPFQHTAVLGFLVLSLSIS